MRSHFLIVHPVTWTKSERINALESHLGVVRPSFRLSKPGAIQTWITEENVLWMGAPKLLGGRMFQRDNWHSGDINLFWHNIYVNVQERTQNGMMKWIPIPNADILTTFRECNFTPVIAF